VLEKLGLITMVLVFFAQTMIQPLYAISRDLTVINPAQFAEARRIFLPAVASGNPNEFYVAAHEMEDSGIGPNTLCAALAHRDVRMVGSELCDTIADMQDDPHTTISALEIMAQQAPEGSSLSWMQTTFLVLGIVIVAVFLVTNLIAESIIPGSSYLSYPS